jgi:hypothetical protein
MKLVAQKRRVYAKYKDHLHPAVKKINKKTTKAVRDAKYNFETKLALNIKKDTKSFFAYVRGNSKSNSFPGPLQDSSGKLLETVTEVVEEFNEYFSSVFTIDKDPNTLQT